MHAASPVSCRHLFLLTAFAVLLPAFDSSAVVPTDNQISEPSTTLVDLPLPKLLKHIPELHGLKPANDQEPLTLILEKVGDKAETLFHKMPSLLSHEEVLQSRNGAKPTRQDFGYLILSHPTEKDVTLDEYRFELQDRSQSPEDALNLAAIVPGSSAASIVDLERRSVEASSHSKGALPLSQGFANSWVYFYPANRSQATFRYLGQQRMNGRNTFVIAFAQIPSAVQSPGELRSEGHSFPIFCQGIAWVEQSDFRILQLRTDLLTPISGVHLHQLTAEINFGETSVARTDPLWLPQKVVITVVSGDMIKEQHFYSDYRAYVVESKIKY